MIKFFRLFDILLSFFVDLLTLISGCCLSFCSGIALFTHQIWDKRDSFFLLRELTNSTTYRNFIYYYFVIYIRLLMHQKTLTSGPIKYQFPFNFPSYLPLNSILRFRSHFRLFSTHIYSNLIIGLVTDYQIQDGANEVNKI